MLCELQAGEVHGSGFKCDVVDLRYPRELFSAEKHV